MWMSATMTKILPLIAPRRALPNRLQEPIFRLGKKRRRAQTLRHQRRQVTGKRLPLARYPRRGWRPKNEACTFFVLEGCRLSNLDHLCDDIYC